MRFVFTLIALAYSSVCLSFHVVIDAGHGGSDRGAAHNGAIESEIALSIAKKVREELTRNKNIVSSLTREKNEFLTLERRAEMANERKASLYLSIHCNSSPDRNARGKEIYFQNQLPPDEESLFLANLENQGAKGLDSSESAHDLPDVLAIVEDLKRNHRLSLSGKVSELIHLNWPSFKKDRAHPIRQAPFFVISNVNMPSALIEVGYLSNPDEAKMLMSDDFQQKLAQSIAQSVRDFKEFIDKGASTTIN
jgi:N-acetylmuramoyl-L-alanine amidase